MSPRPDFLSPLLNLDGIWEERLTELYEIFVRDFIQNPCYYEKNKIVFDKNKSINGKKEDGFWHLITHEDEIIGRIPEYKRAKRLHWIRPIIENYNNPNIVNFDYSEGNNKIRIIGAGFWRKGKQIYEKENNI